MEFTGLVIKRISLRRYILELNHSLSRCDGLETKQKSLCYVFVGVYVNLCTATVIELIVFSYN